jgi:hypothetical protein
VSRLTEERTRPVPPVPERFWPYFFGQVVDNTLQDGSRTHIKNPQIKLGQEFGLSSMLLGWDTGFPVLGQRKYGPGVDDGDSNSALTKQTE